LIRDTARWKDDNLSLSRTSVWTLNVQIHFTAPILWLQVDEIEFYWITLKFHFEFFLSAVPLARDVRRHELYAFRYRRSRRRCALQPSDDCSFAIRTTDFWQLDPICDQAKTKDNS
jgi:hypothetical protein